MNGLNDEPGWRQAWRDVVELVAVEVEAADQRADRAVVRADGDECRFDFRHLRDAPVRALLHHADDGAALDAPVGGAFSLSRLVANARPAPLICDFLARRQHRADQLVGEASSTTAATMSSLSGWSASSTSIALVGFVLVVRDFHVTFRAAIAVALFVVHHAAPHREVGGVLVGLGDRGEDVQAARVGVFLELLVHQLARHLGNVFGMHAEFGAVGLDLELFVLGLLVLRLGDVAELAHALQDVLLARAGALRIDHRVVGRRRLRQAGQHGRFGDA